MAILSDSSLVSAWRPSGNFDARANARRPDTLILHYTAMLSAEAAIDWLTSPESKVSAHYLIDEDGAITQMVAEDRRAWHAGQSYWAGETDLNSCSIGIELQNLGHAAPDGVLPAYPDAQMESLEALCHDLLSRHAIPPEHVLAHSDVAPARKQDPGERFDWARLARAGIGHYVAPMPVEGDEGFGVGEEGDHVLAVQRAFAAYGYGIELTGTYARELEDVVTAFQRHFRPEKIDGRVDRSTRATLEHLLDLLRPVA